MHEKLEAQCSGTRRRVTLAMVERDVLISDEISITIRNALYPLHGHSHWLYNITGMEIKGRIEERTREREKEPTHA